MIQGLFFITSTMIASLGIDYVPQPELSIPQPDRRSAISRAIHEERLAEKELKKLTGVVTLLGGKSEYAKILQKAGREFEIDPLFLTAVTYVESSFRPTAESHKKARGMMQLCPVVLEVLGVTNPWDPQENIMAGAAYLKNCFERYGKYSNSTYLVLAAYNIGPGSPEKLINSDAAERFVKKVLHVYNRYSDLPITTAEVQRKEALNPKQAQKNE